MKRPVHTLLVTAGLFAFWVVLSGRLDAEHLGMGLGSAIAVSLLSSGQLFSSDGRGGRFYLSYLAWPRVLLYLPWLAWEVVKANLHVLRLVLGPRSLWQPRVVRFDPGLRSELAQVALANSITLTPGTVTLDVDGGTFVVHAIDAAVADDLLEGTMGRKVEAAFEPKGGPAE